MSTLLKVKDRGRYRPATRDEVLDAAASYMVEEHRGPAITSQGEGVEVARTMAAGRDYEQVGVIFLDQRHRLLGAEVLFRGTIDGAVVYAREVVKRTLELRAAAAILFHNHPSGNCEPSVADKRITKKLQEALRLIDVRLLDHLVVTNTTHVSMAERGML